MIHIQPLRSRRMNLRLREISAGAAIRLAGIHPDRHEFATSEFLRSIVESADTPTPQHVTDPRLWTVQERTLVVCHYIAAISPLGGADFSVGDDGKFTDYMVPERDYLPSVDLGAACDDNWSMVPMSGLAAESIEWLAGSVPNIPAGRTHWLIGSMAAQLVRTGKDDPAPVDDAAYQDWLKARMAVFADFPDSDFVELVRLRSEGVGKLLHLFDMDISESGMVVLPNEGGEGKDLPPARFPVDVCLSEMAKRLGKSLQKSNS